MKKVALLCAAALAIATPVLAAQLPHCCANPSQAAIDADIKKGLVAANCKAPRPLLSKWDRFWLHARDAFFSIAVPFPMGMVASSEAQRKLTDDDLNRMDHNLCDMLSQLQMAENASR